MSEIARWDKWDSPMLQDVAGQWVRYDNHRAEVERLTAERDAAQAEVKRLTEQVGALTLALEQADEMKANAEAAVLVEEAETDRVLAERNAAQVEVKRLTEQVGALTLAVEQADEMKAHAEASAAAEEAETDRVTAERDAAQAEVERLRSERDMARTEVQRLIAERDQTANRPKGREVGRFGLDGHYLDAMEPTRPTDEDIWLKLWLLSMPDFGERDAAEMADGALAEYRKRWPR